MRTVACSASAGRDRARKDIDHTRRSPRMWSPTGQPGVGNAWSWTADGLGRGVRRQGPTGDQAVTAANAGPPRVGRTRPAGAWFLDLNSAAPQQKQRAADVVERAGGRYVEAAVMSPITPARLAAPMLLGGPHADGVRRVRADARLHRHDAVRGHRSARPPPRSCAGPIMVKGCRSAGHGIDAGRARLGRAGQRPGVAGQPAARRRLGEPGRLPDLPVHRARRPPRRGDARGRGHRRPRPASNR